MLCEDNVGRPTKGWSEALGRRIRQVVVAESESLQRSRLLQRHIHTALDILNVIVISVHRSSNSHSSSDGNEVLVATEDAAAIQQNMSEI